MCIWVYNGAGSYHVFAAALQGEARLDCNYVAVQESGEDILFKELFWGSKIMYKAQHEVYDVFRYGLGEERGWLDTPDHVRKGRTSLWQVYRGAPAKGKGPSKKSDTTDQFKLMIPPHRWA